MDENKIIENSDNREYLEMRLPEYLEEDIREYKRLIREGGPYSSYWGEVYSSINIAFVEDEITDEQAKYLRKKYLGI